MYGSGVAHRSYVDHIITTMIDSEEAKVLARTTYGMNVPEKTVKTKHKSPDANARMEALRSAIGALLIQNSIHPGTSRAGRRQVAVCQLYASWQFTALATEKTNAHVQNKLTACSRDVVFVV